MQIELFDIAFFPTASLATKETFVASCGRTSASSEAALIPDDVEASTKPMVQVEAGGERCAHCTREGVVAAMVNFGCKAYPKYRCKPCHAAVRALERSAKSKGEKAFAAFSEQRRQRPRQFSEVVLQLRLSPEGEQPLPGIDDQAKVVGCASLSERREKCASMVTTIYTDNGTEEFDDMEWLTDRQFRTFMRAKEDMSAAESQQEWDKAMIDPEAEKRVRKGQTQLAVLAKSGCRHYRRKGSRKTYEESEASSDPAGKDSSGSLKARLQTSEPLSNLWEGQEGVPMGRNFVDGCLLVRGRERRENHNILSLEARQHFAGMAKTFLAKSYDQKGSQVKSLQSLVKKLGADNVEVIASGCVPKLQEFEATCEVLQDKKVSAKGWNKKNFVSQYVDAFTIFLTAFDLNKGIVTDLNVLKAVRLLEVRQLSGERRKAALVIRRAAKGLVTQSLWKSALTWFGQRGLAGEDVRQRRPDQCGQQPRQKEGPAKHRRTALPPASALDS